MRQGNEGSSFLPKPDSWVGWGFFAIGALFTANAIMIVFFNTALIEVATRPMYVLVIHLVIIGGCWVNIEHQPSDRAFNLLILCAGLAWALGVKIPVSMDATNLQNKLDQAQQNVASGVQQHTTPAFNPTTRTVTPQAVPQRQAATPRRDTNSYYNPYRKNGNSGGNYNACVGLLRAGNIAQYKRSGCNTGARLPQANIATCRKWESNGTMTQYQKEGCGIAKPAWRGQWCALGVGQQGQNRAAFCR